MKARENKKTMNTPKRKRTSKAPAKNKPGPKPGTGGRPRKPAPERRIAIPARVRADTLARWISSADDAGQSLGAYLDNLDNLPTSKDPAQSP